MKEPRRGTLYVCPIINAMGPVVDARHADLLDSWEVVDKALGQIFDPAYRRRYCDSAGEPMVFSWFFISWSGFRSNPVQRDFGWFNVFDHYRERWGDRMAQYGDQLYWMYNHPAASGVGNEWGLDWLENSHYLEILMRYVAERAYFPSVVQVVTEKNDTSHFLENFFPYDLGNRNSVDVNWNALNADGKPMFEVIDWRRATHQWEIYAPDAVDYQSRGAMKRRIGRLVDIKSIVHELKEYEIEKAFQLCLEGHDAMLSAYEHDFRDRAEVIHERMIEPIHRLSKKYPEVSWSYRNSLDAFNLMNAPGRGSAATFTTRVDRNGNVMLLADNPIFGTVPFTFLKNGDAYRLMPFLRVGENVWLVPSAALDPGATLYVACNSPSGRTTIQHFAVDAVLAQTAQP